MPAALPEAGGQWWVCLGLRTEPFGGGGAHSGWSKPHPPLTPVPDCGWLDLEGCVLKKKGKKDVREKKQSFVWE